MSSAHRTDLPTVRGTVGAVDGQASGSTPPASGSGAAWCGAAPDRRWAGSSPKPAPSSLPPARARAGGARVRRGVVTGSRPPANGLHIASSAPIWTTWSHAGGQGESRRSRPPAKASGSIGPAACLSVTRSARGVTPRDAITPDDGFRRSERVAGPALRSLGAPGGRKAPPWRLCHRLSRVLPASRHRVMDGVPLPGRGLRPWQSAAPGNGAMPDRAGDRRRVRGSAAAGQAWGAPACAGQGVSTSIRPARTAASTRAGALLTSSLRISDIRWLSTVLGLSARASAMSLLVRPRAMPCRT